MRQYSRAFGPQRGFVLIITLWVMVILGVMLTNLAYQVRVEAALERAAIDRSQLRWAARGALHLAADAVREHLEDDYHSSTADWWSDPKRYRDLPLGAATVSLLRETALEPPAYGLDDEESRLNINVVSAEQLAGFDGISPKLAEALVEFRDTLAERQAEAAGEAQAEPGSARASGESDEEKTPFVDGPIRSLRELLEVEGMSEALLFEPREQERPPLAALWTTRSSGKLNVNTAPGVLLSALGLAQDAISGFVEDRGENPIESVDALRGRLGIGIDPKRWEQLAPLLDVRSSTFRLLARAKWPGRSSKYSIDALLYASEQKLAYVRWQER